VFPCQWTVSHIAPGGQTPDTHTLTARTVAKMRDAIDEGADRPRVQAAVIDALHGAGGDNCTPAGVARAIWEWVQA